MATQDLWGDLPLSESVRTPVTILREQAALLGQKTESLLQGHVTFQRSGLRSGFQAELEIVAPLLDDYSYHVLTVEYPVTLYPVTISPDSNIKDPSLLSERPIECPDEAKFIQALGAILSRSQVKRVISSLVAQSRENS